MMGPVSKLPLHQCWQCQQVSFPGTGALRGNKWRWFRDTEGIRRVSKITKTEDKTAADHQTQCIQVVGLDTVGKTYGAIKSKTV